MTPAITAAVRKYFAKIGKTGGEASMHTMTKKERSARAKLAGSAPKKPRKAKKWVKKAGKPSRKPDNPSKVSGEAKTGSGRTGVRKAPKLDKPPNWENGRRGQVFGSQNSDIENG